VPAADPETSEWLDALTAGGRRRDESVDRLHGLLLRIARGELHRRSAVVTGPELDDLAHQAAADALLAILGKLDSFRGESRFTTWAYKFVIFEVSAKLGRHFWRHREARLDVEDGDRLAERHPDDPAEHTEARDLVAALRRAVAEELTVHQRRVFTAVVMNEVPLDALVAELDSNRNAVYKTLFDARRKLRTALAANGYLRSDAVRPA
jgi:RNA polymerase sigma-70 factor (ECF subfamily)